MTDERFRRIALGMADAVEGEHMSHPDFRGHGRIFATIHADHLYGMVKLTPEQQEQIVRHSPSTFAPESGAWGAVKPRRSKAPTKPPRSSRRRRD